jgi:UDP-N-acetylmuramoylalanine--D-glutamate ligase
MEFSKAIVAGTGKSGISAARLLVKHGIEVFLFDENENRDREEILGKVDNSPLVTVAFGKLTEDIYSAADIMVISPGIPVDAEFVLEIKKRNIPVWSEIELAYYYGKGSIAAITGTNGKTTTTALVGEIVKAYNPKTIVVGNIGIPYTELCDTTDEASMTVAEISSFQLETIVDFHPNVSAVLNLTPDHLNRHYTFENYGNVKLSISKNQTSNDVIVLNYDDEHTRKMGEKVNARVVYFSRLEKPEAGVYVEDGHIILEDGEEKIDILKLEDLKLLGNHNVENVLAAVGISYYMGVPANIIRRAATEFKAVEHRIEYVDTINGVEYYNDSKGTNPDAAIKGIQAMKTSTYLIGGGYDKGSTYDEWIEAFDGKVKCLVLIGQTADKIAETARKHGFENIVIKDSLLEAVTYCHDMAESGEAVLLSPACASWGMFDNYEQRGRMFKEYVGNFKE